MSEMATIGEEQAADLYTILHGQNPDPKIHAMTTMKGDIKHKNVDLDAVPIIFDCIRIGLQASNQNLLNQTFSALIHFLKRLRNQGPSSVIRPYCGWLLPLLLEKLGDQKDKIRNNACSALTELWRSCPPEVEKAVKEAGFGSKVPKARELSVKLLVGMNRNSHGFAFRTFTPYLIKLLEDADANVREASKDAVVELFTHAPDHAKSDLKRELVKHQVRKGIATAIINQLMPGGEMEIQQTQQLHEEETQQRKEVNVAGSVAGSIASATTFVSGLPGSELEPLDASYINSNRELEEIFANMHPMFEGRESEQNWLAREKHCTTIRKLLRGNAFKDYQQTFLAGVKALLDGILKAVNSLRTTLSTNGCQLVKDLVIICGPGMDPMAELLLTNLIKLCANTKKITAQMGNVTAAVVFANVSYHPKILGHIWGACQDKNVQPRTFATGWIKIMLEAHADHKGYLEHTGGLEILEKCLKKGLADANPGVREGMRATFWKFQVVWPDRASVIIDGLDGTSKKLLEKENPNAGATAAAKDLPSQRAPLGRSATAPSTRPSIKEAILAKKRAAAKAQERADAAPPMMQPPQTPLAPPAGYSQAPVRPQRPKVAKAQTEARPPAATTALTGYGERAYTNRAVSPAETHSSRGSPSHHSRSNAPASPPQTIRINRQTPARHSPLVNRKLTLLEKLNHHDWEVRVQGIVIVACILAKRPIPDYDGSRVPTLPPSDTLAPTLQKLLNDPQPEVVENVVAPEVLPELAKVVPLEQIMTKVLLLISGDDEIHNEHIKQMTMPALKALMTEAEQAELLFKIINSFGASNVVPRKLASGGSYTTAQKRKITHGCLVWLNELVLLMLHGGTNEFLSDSANYRGFVTRFLTMLNGTKAPNYHHLAMLLKNLKALDPYTFGKILGTFENQVVRDLKKAWGQPVEEEDFYPIEEKVAHVQEVLGEIPVIDDASSSKAPAPARHNPNGRQKSPEPVSPTISKFRRSRDEEGLTQSVRLDRPPSSPRGASEDKENKGAEFGDSGTHLGVRKNGNVIKIYQDPVIESNGAVATGGVPDKNAAGSTEWYRSKMKKQISNSNLPKTPEQSMRLLSSLISRLKARDLDTQAWRKLTGIVRENPVRGVLQENNGEEHFDIWQGGVVFDDLLTALLEYLQEDANDDEPTADSTTQGLITFKQLLAKAHPYFTRHETAVLTTLIHLRGKYPNHSQVTSGIEEISEEFMGVADPAVSIDAILNIMMPGGAKENWRPQTQSWCMALSCLAQLVKTSKLASLESQFGRLGVLAVKSLDDPDAEVRRACVSMCIEMSARLDDDQRLFDEILKGTSSNQQNLLTYYFAKEVKREGRVRGV